MNKTDRMLAIVLELQKRNNRRAEDLAATFETSVRTIYRDMQALSEAGVPVVGSPGKGYSLMEGYFLPPVSFTPGESVALVIGTEFIEQRFDSDYAVHAGRARDKITAVLPPAVREEAERVRSAMKLRTEGTPAGSGSAGDTMKLLRRAILDSRKVAFNYRKRYPDEEEAPELRRTVSPYGLVLVNGAWILVADCGLRKEIRHFRLSRMSEPELLEETFRRPPDFDLTRYTPPDDRKLYARVRVTDLIADRVRESGNFFLEGIQEQEDGFPHLVFRIRKPTDLLHTVMGWGAGAWVLEPEELRRLVREEILQMTERY
ncbi:helix-turn-helix transcriptional regulator [Gorillibacterium sp. sgz5001074]|uniref:helix-turn-helix transcriptional regulator n=1 Tax=Gorillibacterium sp. sgz5001074 TaxID=3446695 RepID=UPI003F67496A